ncbi:excinuclease Cho [Stenotrophomonas sp. AN71]|uniref:endonuclease n=1 Tax=Stenotrophomonas sp. AN71 TaxID=3156253 RepID=UPI003D1C34E6
MSSALNVLRSDLAAKVASLPRLPGVYTFHDAAGAALYIGKSVDIRRRVLDHLRAPDEQRLVGRTTHFSCIRTAGDIGAQLLEARLIKQTKPLFNQRLRRNKRLCTIVLAGDEVRIEDVHTADPLQAYGLFPSRHAAVAALERVADEQQLCLGRLGIESVRAGAPCFRHLLKRCSGVCTGIESAPAHDERLRTGLAGYHQRAWPYAGAIGIEERSGNLKQIHVVRNWTYLGSATTIAGARRLDTPAIGFDRDGYSVLARPLIGESVKVIFL